GSSSSSAGRAGRRVVVRSSTPSTHSNVGQLFDSQTIPTVPLDAPVLINSTGALSAETRWGFDDARPGSVPKPQLSRAHHNCRGPPRAPPPLLSLRRGVHA